MQVFEVKGVVCKGRGALLVRRSGIHVTKVEITGQWTFVPTMRVPACGMFLQ